MLARLRPDAQELSLCFDPTSDAIGDFEEGEALFDGDQPTEFTKGILQFNEAFEQAGGRTQAFMKELKELDLLMDGEISIQPEGAERSEEHTSELQSLMRISYAVFCLKKNKQLARTRHSDKH